MDQTRANADAGQGGARGAIVLDLPFPIPLSQCFTNSAVKGRRVTSRYSEWRAEANAAILEQRPHPVRSPIVASPVSVAVTLYPPDRRERDADNMGKSILDALVHGGVVEDDSNAHVRHLSFVWGDPIATGACRVRVTPITGDDSANADTFVSIGEAVNAALDTIMDRWITKVEAAQ